MSSAAWNAAAPRSVRGGRADRGFNGLISRSLLNRGSMRPTMGREGGASIAMERDKTTLNVRQVTNYDFARPVQFGEHRFMMRPRDRHDQRLVSSELVIDPRPARLRWIYDAFDNCVAIASFSGASASLRVESRFTVERTQDDQP